MASHNEISKDDNALIIATMCAFECDHTEYSKKLRARKLKIWILHIVAQWMLRDRVLRSVRVTPQVRARVKSKGGPAFMETSEVKPGWVCECFVTVLLDIRFQKTEKGLSYCTNSLSTCLSLVLDYALRMQYAHDNIYSFFSNYNKIKLFDRNAAVYDLSRDELILDLKPAMNCTRLQSKLQSALPYITHTVKYVKISARPGIQRLP